MMLKPIAVWPMGKGLLGLKGVVTRRVETSTSQLSSQVGIGAFTLTSVAPGGACTVMSAGQVRTGAIMSTASINPKQPVKLAVRPGANSTV